MGEPLPCGNDRDNTGDTEAKRLKIRSHKYEYRMVKLVSEVNECCPLRS